MKLRLQRKIISLVYWLANPANMIDVLLAGVMVFFIYRTMPEPPQYRYTGSDVGFATASSVVCQGEPFVYTLTVVIDGASGFNEHERERMRADLGAATTGSVVAPRVGVHAWDLNLVRQVRNIDTWEVAPWAPATNVAVPIVLGRTVDAVITVATDGAPPGNYVVIAVGRGNDTRAIGSVVPFRVNACDSR